MLSTKLVNVLWALLRPQTYLLMCIYVVLGVVYGLTILNQPLGTFLSTDSYRLVYLFGALALWYIAGTAFNDYADYEIDKINLKHDSQRPLVQGTIQKNDILRIGIGASLLSLSLAVFTHSAAVMSLFTALLLLNAAYSLRPIQISHRGGLAPLLLPLGYIVLTVCSGIAIVDAPFGPNAALLVASMYLHFMSRIILKDHRDVKGDAKLGKKTLVLSYGNRRVAIVALTLFALGTAGLLTSLWNYVAVAKAFAIMLAAGSVVTLLNLSQEERWPYQKPLITIFGRFCSGVVIMLIVGLVANIVTMTTLQLKFTLVVTAALFFTSIFNILKMQSPGAKTGRKLSS